MTEHPTVAASGFRTSLLEEADGPAHNPTANPTMGEIIAIRFSRRDLLKGACRFRISARPSRPLLS